jgi:rifampin ADP-ribosylating transferase
VTVERCGTSGAPSPRTNASLEVGDELVPGRGSTFQQGRVSNNLYFTALGHSRLGSGARNGADRK